MYVSNQRQNRSLGSFQGEVIIQDPSISSTMKKLPRIIKKDSIGLLYPIQSIYLIPIIPIYPYIKAI